MTAAPGWYPDPAGGRGQRYFDGTNWGPTAPPPPSFGGGERRITIHYGFALLAIFSLFGTLLPAISLMSTASDPDTEGIGATLGVLWLVWGGMWTLVWTAFAIHHTLRSRR